MAQPVISSFSPASGLAGSTVTISGNGFSPAAAGNIVYFGAVRATVQSASATSLTVTVPAGATYQPITVTVAGLTGYAARPFVLKFSGGGNINAGTFGAKVDFDTDLNPNGIAICDFDGDGRSDLATPGNYTTAGAASFTVLRNTSTAGALAFAPKQIFSNGGQTYALAAGDLDGDGKPDIVVASIADQAISVFRNTSSPGAISFAPKINFPSGSAPFSIGIGDIDGDGRPDIAVVNATANSISVFRNTGSVGAISFDPKVDFITQLNPQSLAVGDLDGDGRPDIAVTNKLSYSFSIFRNTSSSGSIAFAPRTDITNGSGNETKGISLADFNEDGRLDVSVVISQSSTGSSFAQIFRNQGSPGTVSFNFATSVSGSAFAASYFAAPGDANGDGRIDLALSITGNGRTKLFENFTAPAATFFSLSEAAELSSFSPYGVGLGDLDGDSKPELVTTYFISDKVSVFLNRSGLPGITSFTPATAGAGATVTITGANFTGATAVSFGGVPAASFTVVNATTITAVVGPGASGNVVVTTPAGTGSAAGFTFFPAPVVTAFTPAVGGAGTTVTITGTQFASVTGVSFGGVPAASFSQPNATTVTAVVGAGASGNVSVTNFGGTGSMAGFTFLAPPQISAFSPAAAAAGDTVTITGTNFTGAAAVGFGGVAAASFTIVNAATIRAVVANGASGNITVTSPGGTGSRPGFTYLYRQPVISSFTPASAPYGMVVTITGTDFYNVSAVSFGGTPAVSFTVVNSTTITATPGAGASGNAAVTTPGGTGSRPGFTYIAPPVITSLMPDSGAVGSVITLNGQNFSNSPAGNAVYFGAVRAEVLSATATQLTVKIPAGVTYQQVSVTANHLTGYSAKPFVVTFPGATDRFSVNTFVSTGFTYGVGSLPDAVCAADLDGDGKPDIVTADKDNGFTSGISVLRNTSLPGNIAFAPRAQFLAGAYPGNVTAGDLNGDGKTDIAVSYLSGIRIFKNAGTTGNILLEVQPPLSTVGGATGIDIGDLDGDGRPDFAMSKNSTDMVAVFRNIGQNGNLAFGPQQDISSYSAAGPAYNIKIRDLDGDGKPDLIVSHTGTMSFLRNTSTIGTIAFAARTTLPGLADLRNFITADVDGDGKPDMIVTHNGIAVNNVTVYRNISTPGNIAFDAGTAKISDIWPNALAAADFDGDGKPDIVATDAGGTFFIAIKNKSTAGTVVLDAPVKYTGGYNNSSVLAADFDADNKPDIAIARNSFSGIVSVFKNRANEPVATALCPGGSGSNITAGLTGTAYQWKRNTGSGFVNLADDAHHTGSNTGSLQLTNIPSSWYGYTYVCMVDGVASDTFTLRIVSTWTGTAGAAWENPANWGCGQLPDANTDVFINSGTVVLNGSTAIRSIKIRPGVNFTVVSGATLTVLY